MARPRSEDKQIALLNAAAEIIASHGIGAAMLLISKQAGVAEGTLFRYFPTKDDLLNELYLYIKQNLGDVLKQNCRQNAPLNELVHALWNSYIEWGIANPAAIKTLKQLLVSDRITPQTHAKVAELLPEIHEISSASVASGHLASLPQEFADAIFMALADTTMLFAAQNTEQSEVYKTAGFNVLWEGFTR
ncbi:transcriptional regulator, TetR family [Aeromonas sp. RU39B]|uniref:TetR/AcrR family transcriptional regulator n=1 Tax=Aeromonas sp. RU39B TaxID=1907416 RepID=UPI0009554A06|nr:TetR/AcrR family transcriptional regulator [Aeromonas sp. RU39B]SIQ40172.1 transcriptional regulator, TetR family [Aeromonas sp. RU39B]